MATNNPKLANSAAVVISASCAIIFIALITAAADLVPPVKDWLKVTFTHHWIGKGVLATGLFFALWLFFFLVYRKPRETSLVPLLRFLSWVTVLGTLAIFSFFLYEAFLSL